MLGPVVEDRPAVEPDHVRHRLRRAFGAEGEADALEKAEQVEFGLRPHVFEHLFGREVLDPDDEPLAEGAELLRQRGIGLAGQGLHFLEGGRAGVPPSLAVACHGVFLGEGTERAKPAEIRKSGDFGPYPIDHFDVFERTLWLMRRYWAG